MIENDSVFGREEDDDASSNNGSHEATQAPPTQFTIAISNRRILAPSSVADSSKPSSPFISNLENNTRAVGATDNRTSFSPPPPSTTTTTVHASPPAEEKMQTATASSENFSHSLMRSAPLVPDQDRNAGMNNNNNTYNSSSQSPPRATQQRHKSQMLAAPTGGSDSDTDADDASELTGAASPSSLPLASRIGPSPSTDEEDDEEERRFVDEFGFVIDEDEKDRGETHRLDGKRVVRREVKWASMASDWNRTNTKMHAKLKERCRKGIPARLRGVAWQLLLGSRAQMNSPENAEVYVALVNKKLREQDVDNIISRDLARTFPNHILFQEEGGVGQTFLRHVLHAYAGCDPEVGYVQGMAFLVGALSTQMGEEESFWALHEMMYNDRYKMRELFKPGFPMLQQFFYQLRRLIERFLPKLSKRFTELQIEPSFYASQWFLTLFVYHFPFRALLRIWDVFFSEGWKIIFRVAIALMKWEEKRLLSLEFEELLPALKSLQDGKDAHELLRRAHRIKFKTAQLNKYGDEYWESIGSSASR